MRASSSKFDGISRLSEGSLKRLEYLDLDTGFSCKGVNALLVFVMCEARGSRTFLSLGAIAIGHALCLLQTRADGLQ
jgi:hypothetical protein